MPGNINFILNNELISEELNPAMVLLDFIRSKKLTGTKEGCKEGDCGACTVLSGEIDNSKNEIIYSSINSCLVPLHNINGKHIVTIEGLNLPGKELTPVQQAFVSEGASQCGFCTPGFIVSLTGYFLNGAGLKFKNVKESLDGNICRCTGHNSIIRAAEKIARKFESVIHTNGTRNSFLIENKIIPPYFPDIRERLLNLSKAEDLRTKGSGEHKYVSGGTDLFVQTPDEMLDSEIIFLSSNPLLKGITVDNGVCCIGSLTTLTEILDSDIMNGIYPGITEFAGLFGSTPIRNTATIGGNINNASPIGDSTVLFLALNSDVILTDGKSKRSVPLKDFYKSYKSTEKKSGEYMSGLTFPVPDENYSINFEKVSKRTYLDIASVNSAILVNSDNGIIRDINISAGGVSPIPLFLSKTCEFLKEKQITPEIILKATLISQDEISPISDARGSADYKRMLLTGLLKTHFIKLFPEIIRGGESF